MKGQPLVVRGLVGVAAALTVATAFSSPGGADPNDDNFIDALSHAGIEYGEPGNAMAVGQSICPMLTAPGGNFATAASGVARRGMPPQIARAFTTIAIQTYCPDQLSSNGITGVPGV